jgi:3-phosphoshikimate 1-carboxyvinyltransferase
MLGLDIFQIDGTKSISVSSEDIPAGETWVVPKDFSAAAFFLVAGTIVPNSMLVLEGVGINPSRTALLDILRGMGAELTIVSERSFARETIADIGVESADLHGVTIPPDRVANLIDEIPILAIAATQAKGTTVIRGASELRVKETDRIDATVRNLKSLGANITEFEDGFEITGPTRLQGCTLDSFGDHRIAMSASIAGLVASGNTIVKDGACSAVSFPNFLDEIQKISLLG